MKKYLIILSLFTFSFNAISQDSTGHKLLFSGYVSFTESVMDLDLPDERWLWEHQLQNRLNVFYFPSDKWSFSLQMRNRLMGGDRFTMDIFKGYNTLLESDAGLVDCSWNLLKRPSWVLNAAVDRLWMKYRAEKLEITAGRQRINWGQTYVWNNNDWFNNYSFFDVDYMEKPGSDAMKVQYFSGVLSSLEAVVSMDSARKITAAGMFKTNFRSFDLQFLGGVLLENDIALGFGWAGGLGSLGFRGEMSYLHPVKKLSDTTGLYFLSVALDYTFSNSLTIQTEAFYNQLRSGSEASFMEFYARPSSIKHLSFTEFNFYAGISYPFTPLINGSVSVIYFPKVKGYYLGPSLTYSLGNNLEMAVILQYFNGEFFDLMGIDTKQRLLSGFGRIKWSF